MLWGITERKIPFFCWLFFFWLIFRQFLLIFKNVWKCADSLENPAGFDYTKIPEVTTVYLHACINARIRSIQNDEIHSRFACMNIFGCSWRSQRLTIFQPDDVGRRVANSFTSDAKRFANVSSILCRSYFCFTCEVRGNEIFIVVI